MKTILFASWRLSRGVGQVQEGSQAALEELHDLKIKGSKNKTKTNQFFDQFWSRNGRRNGTPKNRKLDRKWNRNWNSIWRTEMRVENANTVNCRCRCRYKSCQMNKGKELQDISASWGGPFEDNIRI